MFDPLGKLLLGLFTGMLFGFLLQKGHASKFRVIVGQLLLADWTVLKIMATAIAVGAVGVSALVGADLASLHVKPFHYGGILLGAVCFGVGLAVLGYCPGTSVAASGEGRRDALIGVLGMLAGATVFVFTYPGMRHLIKGAGGAGEVTFPGLLGIPAWLAVAGAVLLIALLLGALEYVQRRGRAPANGGQEEANRRPHLLSRPAVGEEQPYRREQ